MASYSYNEYDSKSSGLMDEFFDRFGQYIEGVIVEDNPCWTRPEISLTFSRWTPGSADERVVREAQRRWNEIQRLIFNGLLSRSKALYSCRKFMDSRNTASTTAYPDGYRIKFDKEKPFAFALDRTMHAPTNDQWIKMVNTVLGKCNEKEKEMTPRMTIMNIEKVVFNGPATIIFWKDKTKTVVKCMEGDAYDPEKAVLLACLEHTMGGKGPAKKWLKKMTEGAPQKAGIHTDWSDFNEKLSEAVANDTKYQARHDLFKDFVDWHAAKANIGEWEFLSIMAACTCYARKTAYSWYDGIKPISDTAWKRICKAYPDITDPNLRGE